jgi:hypothetical protein
MDKHLLMDLLTVPKTPVTHNYPGGSPEVHHFNSAPLTRQASRWKQDFEELELLVHIACRFVSML